MGLFLLSTPGPAVVSKGKSTRGEFSMSSPFTAAALDLNKTP